MQELKPGLWLQKWQGLSERAWEERAKCLENSQEWELTGDAYTRANNSIKAKECYDLAELHYRDINQLAAAATLGRRLQNWTKAANIWEELQKWQEAATDWKQAEEFERAAELYEKAKCWAEAESCWRHLIDTLPVSNWEILGSTSPLRLSSLRYLTQRWFSPQALTSLNKSEARLPPFILVA